MEAFVEMIPVGLGTSVLDKGKLYVGNWFILQLSFKECALMDTLNTIPSKVQ